MVAVPALTPVTTPADDTVALAVPLLHDPPVTVLLSVIVAASQTFVEPEIVPAFGSGLMVMTVVAYAVPQPLVTV
jgi:hypothetical protein